ncbi:thiol reductant ABC exporter subunit CydD [Micropruina sonneratiae]|uniref:thiol reductant ABC exporter subunit CydD n=1 Tax=Micropruina sonneratiae TaxID=2986940 RepID=UPI002225DF20|nr:thiol reductant ABC exporter subunit CydD [Micropruina sp. KQZ13P-5]MCW3159051.1 thiol reductant ABC exporter subunit CydD [Micropruina sp. KQZ13P-5]
MAYLVAGVAVGSLTAVLTIVQAWALASALGTIFETHTLGVLGWAVPTLVAVFTGKAVLAWLNQWLAHRAAAAVKSRLRRDVLAARLADPVAAEPSTASVVTLLTQGLDALDGYYSKYLPQLVLAFTVPLIIGVAILTADFTSALIVACTVPLIPVFMALVGWTTEARTRKRWRVQTRLAGHFADLITGLPTLQVFGRARAQAQGLQRSEAAHRRETMGTLRVSFLSALILELLASLSVAIVAVAIGFRVVFHELDLTTAFFVLILAPEVYLPVRQVGVHYHDAADGMAAAESAFAIIEGAAPAGREPVVPVEPPAAGVRPGQPDLLRIDGLTVAYPGSAAPVLDDVSVQVRRGELAVLTGTSGVGKTTLLHALMGFVPAGAGRFLLEGREANAGQRRGRIAWVGQNPGMVNGTIADNVRLGDAAAPDDEVRHCLDLAGGSSLDPRREVGDDGEGLSAGERRRVAVARAALRVRSGRADLLVLDEPTAGLDGATEASVLDALSGLGATVLAVSHRPAVIARADRLIPLSPAG